MGERFITKNIGITREGTFFPFQSTVLKKTLETTKWFEANEYFQSTVGLHTGAAVSIDGVMYRVMRVDKKRNKIWMGEPTKSKLTGKE